MAKFIYKLQNVLDIKIKLESQAKTTFSLAAAKLNAEENKLIMLNNRLVECEEKYRQVSLGKLDIAEIKFAKENVEYVKGEIVEQNNVINRAKKELEIARFHLSEAIKDRKIHEKLKEKAFDDFLMEENDNEKKEIDQLVSFRYNNNRKAGED